MDIVKPVEPTKVYDEARKSKLIIFRQHLKSCTRRSPCSKDIWHGFDISDSPEMYMEERRKHEQTKLARGLVKLNKARLLTGFSPFKTHAAEEESQTETEVRKKPGRKGQKGANASKKKSVILESLMMEEQNMVIKLKDVGFQLTYGQFIFGTLETHVNGFLFMCSSFNLHFLFKDIKGSFFEFSDSNGFPLLRFYLKTCIKVGNENKNDILFNLDSNCAKEVKRDDDLKNFLRGVQDKWSCSGTFSDLVPIEEMYEDCGLVSYKGKETILFLTSFSIVVQEVPPYGPVVCVIDEADIEIVNFCACQEELITMTVICKDFKVDSMVEIQVPIEAFDDIKNWLHLQGLKYYLNNVSEWESRVKKIADNFQVFLERGGWDQYKLEDPLTVKDYYSMESESESDSDSDSICGDSCSDSDSEEK